MSSRKRNKRTAGSAETETSASELPEAPAADEAAPPAVSEIVELRPHDAEVAEEHAAVSGEAEAEEEEEVEGDELPETKAPKTRAHLKRVIESLIFVSDTVITAQQLGRIVKTKMAEVRELVAEISAEYEGRGIELVEVAGGYQFRSAAASAAYVHSLVSQRPVRLTRAQLETLALIAYRQPITRPEIDDVRGVDSGSAIKVLCERELVKILGRKDEAGRPLLYGTTPYFLEFFGMNSMGDLPTLREFTELTDEHRELFKKKTGEVPDLSNEPAPPHEEMAPEEEGEVQDELAPEGESMERSDADDSPASDTEPEQEDAEPSSTDVDDESAATTPHIQAPDEEPESLE